MELIRDDVPEAEVVLRWLQGERDKVGLSDWMKHIGAPDSAMSLIADDATIGDARDDRNRGAMLGFRGYPDTHLFTGWPSPVHWSLVSVERDELPLFRYIKHEGWDEISGGTQSVAEGARRLLAGEPRNETADQYAIRPDLPLDSIIAATDGIDCTLVEGHHRVTSLVMYPDACPDTVAVYLARSDRFRTWPWWG